MFDRHRRIAYGTVELTENDSATGRMFDRSRLRELRAEIDDPGQGTPLTPARRNLVRVVDAVLQRQDRCGASHHGPQGTNGRVGIVGFDAEKDQIDGGDFSG